MTAEPGAEPRAGSAGPAGAGELEERAGLDWQVAYRFDGGAMP